MRVVWRSLVGGVVMVWAAALVASGQQPGGSAEARKLKNPVPATPQSIAEGQKLFQKYCKHCHGEDAKGDGPMAPKNTHPSDLTDDKWDRGSTDGEIYMVIREGAGPKMDMKGFKSKITEKETWALVNYLRSLGSKSKSH